MAGKCLELRKLAKLRGTREWEIDWQNGVDAPRIRRKDYDARRKKHGFGNGVRDENRRPPLFGAQTE